MAWGPEGRAVRAGKEEGPQGVGKAGIFTAFWSGPPNPHRACLSAARPTPADRPPRKAMDRVQPCPSRQEYRSDQPFHTVSIQLTKLISCIVSVDLALNALLESASFAKS